MIDLQQLITVAPLPQDVKNQALAQMDSLSTEQKTAFEHLCWQAITQEYENKIALLRQKALLGGADGKTPLSPIEIKAEEDKLFMELVQKLNAAGTEEELQEVREKLEQVQNGQS